MSDHLFVTPEPTASAELTGMSANADKEAVRNQEVPKPTQLTSAEDEDEVVGESITLTPEKSRPSEKSKRHSKESGKDTVEAQAPSSTAGEGHEESDFYTGEIPKTKAQVLVPVPKKQDTSLASGTTNKASPSVKKTKASASGSMDSMSSSSKKRSAEQMSAEGASFTKIPKALGRHEYHIYEYGDDVGDEPVKEVVKTDESLEKKFKDWSLYNNFQSMDPKDDSTWPPKNVLLQDWHIYELYRSKIPKTNLYPRWPGDFNSVGLLREIRRNKGRAAKAKVEKTWHYIVVGEHYVLCGDEGFSRVNRLIGKSFQKPVEITTGEACAVQTNFVPTKVELLRGPRPKRFMKADAKARKQLTNAPDIEQSTNTNSRQAQTPKPKATTTPKATTPTPKPAPKLKPALKRKPKAPPRSHTPPPPPVPTSNTQLEEAYSSLFVFDSHNENVTNENTQDTTDTSKPKKTVRFATPLSKMASTSEKKLNSRGTPSDQSAHQYSGDNDPQSTSHKNDSHSSSEENSREPASSESSAEESTSSDMVESDDESVEIQRPFKRQMTPLSFEIQPRSWLPPNFIVKEFVTFIANTNYTQEWASAAFNNVAKAIEDAAAHSAHDPDKMSELLNYARQFSVQVADDLYERREKLLIAIQERTDEATSEAIRKEVELISPSMAKPKFHDRVSEPLWPPAPKSPIWLASDFANLNTDDSSEDTVQDGTSSPPADSGADPVAADRPAKAAKLDTPSTAGNQQQQQMARNALSTMNDENNDGDSPANAMNVDGAADADSAATYTQLTLPTRAKRHGKNGKAKLARRSLFNSTSTSTSAFKTLVYGSNPATRPLTYNVSRADMMSFDGSFDFDFDTARNNDGRSTATAGDLNIPTTGARGSGKPSPSVSTGSCVVQ